MKRRSDGATKRRRDRRLRHAFTLTELMIAIAVLLVVIAATSKIFSTAGAVTGAGQAGADVIQEAVAIERQIRQDFERIAEDGFFVIRSVAVRNDINGPVLLNPTLEDDDFVRADQIVFFINGLQTTQTFSFGSGNNRKGQSTSSRVYYGHAFQLPEAKAFAASDVDTGVAHDPTAFFTMVPWHRGTLAMFNTTFTTGAGTNNFSAAGAGQIDATQPEARKWLLSRQSVLLADDDTSALDDNAKTYFLGSYLSARSIFLDDPLTRTNPEIRNGRVDAASTQLTDIRSRIQFTPTGTLRNWGNGLGAPGIDQRSIVTAALYYPRAERLAPSMHRVDQALTNHVISSACSSFRVDWNWEDGVGFSEDPADPANPFFGFSRDPQREIPWFGMPDPEEVLDNNQTLSSCVIYDETGVAPFASDDHWNSANYFRPATIFPTAIESLNSTAGLVLYEAAFGFNRDMPLTNAGTPAFAVGYTPWPTSVRITMTLHDSDTRLEHGREFQFVINLPKRR